MPTLKSPLDTILYLEKKVAYLSLLAENEYKRQAQSPQTHIATLEAANAKLRARIAELEKEQVMKYLIIAVKFVTFLFLYILFIGLSLSLLFGIEESITAAIDLDSIRAIGRGFWWHIYLSALLTIYFIFTVAVIVFLLIYLFGLMAILAYGTLWAIGDKTPWKTIMNE